MSTINATLESQYSVELANLISVRKNLDHLQSKEKVLEETCAKLLFQLWAAEKVFATMAWKITESRTLTGTNLLSRFDLKSLSYLSGTIAPGVNMSFFLTSEPKIKFQFLDKKTLLDFMKTHHVKIYSNLIDKEIERKEQELAQLKVLKEFYHREL